MTPEEIKNMSSFRSTTYKKSSVDHTLNFLLQSAPSLASQGLAGLGTKVNMAKQRAVPNATSDM